jgi:hypothetical protein
VHHVGFIILIDHRYLGRLEMWCWARTEISWFSRVKNEEVLQKVKEERNILHTVTRKKAKWIGHILRRNCLLKHFIEGEMEGRLEVTAPTMKKTEAATG